jgi:DNA-binding PadR family transcriptional regulator
MTPVFRHGRLRLYLLRLLDEEPRHGYEVIRLLRDRFMGVYAPSPGTIYPRLARLEEEGLVTHDEENGRKVYRITDAGREELRRRGSELDELEQELSASVSDIVREVKEDVRETVRTLREELTKAAREMRMASEAARAPGAPGTPDAAAAYRAADTDPWSQASADPSPPVIEAPRSPGDHPGPGAAHGPAWPGTGQGGGHGPAGPGEGRGTAGPGAGQGAGQGGAGEGSRSARDAWEPGRGPGQGRPPLSSAALGSAWAQAREQARLMREQAKHAREHARQARDEALGHARQARDEAMGHAQRLREEAASFRDDLGRERQGQERQGHDWGGWHSWGDWASWTDWPGRKSWPGPGPHNMAAFRDLERLARGFANDMRKVAWDSGALGGDVLTNLHDILDEALDRIKTEVFGARDGGKPPSDDAPKP